MTKTKHSKKELQQKCCPKRVSRSAKWLAKLPMCLTYVTMSEVEDRMLKEIIFYALGITKAVEFEGVEQFDTSIKEDNSYAA